MLRLVYADGDNQASYLLEKNEVILGRSPEADCVISDIGVSRLHARIVRSGEEYTVHDLESRNGTKVNGLMAATLAIRDGDEILLGSFTIRVQSTAAPGVEFTEDTGGGLKEETGTIIRSLGEVEKMLRAAKVQGAAPVLPGAAPDVRERYAKDHDTRDHDKGTRILAGLNRFAQTLISSQSLDEILANVMEIVFDTVPAQRGVLGLYETEGGQLVLKSRAVRRRVKKEDEDKIVIPRTITDRVYYDKVSIITMDAMADPRFAHGMSVLMLGVRSCMCVPLWDRDKVIGIVYVDSDIQAGSFTEDDLNLMTALGNYAALAIERAQLTQKIAEERSIRSRLERYHAPGHIEMIMKSSRHSAEVNLFMQETDVTVLFTDLVGFTPLSETLAPNELTERLNSFFSDMVDVIFKYEGTLDKYIGDCIMAVFGAPIPQEDHPERALRAAMEMHRTLIVLNRERGYQFQVRTGINSGRVMAGDIGCLKRMDYSVLGDTVNIASRLESSVAQPGQIVVGEDTYKRVKEKFVFNDLGKIPLKGKSQKMQAFELLGEAPVD